MLRQQAGFSSDAWQAVGRKERFFGKAVMNPGYIKCLLHAFSQTQAPIFPDGREQLPLLCLSFCFRLRKNKSRRT